LLRDAAAAPSRVSDVAAKNSLRDFAMDPPLRIVTRTQQGVLARGSAQPLTNYCGSCSSIFWAEA